MGYTYDPLLFSGLVPASTGGGGVPIYTTIGSFPVGAATGALGVAADTGIIYEFNGVSWVVAGGPGVILSIGTIDTGTPAANGAQDLSNQLILQSASASLPGLVNTTTQTFAGQKTFSTGLTGTLTGHATLDIPLSAEGVPNGVATLDGSGKIPASQLPSVVMEYQGAWNPNTNTPTLSDGVGTNGFVYYVTALRLTAVPGLTDPSMVNFQIGDLVIYSAALGQWQLATPAAGVQSVNSAQGVVTVNAINQLTGDVTAGPASGSQSEVASLVATSNATLVTLSALSLPGSQVTGNISGNAGNVTGTVAIANGGTGQTTQQASLDAIAGAVTSGDFLRGNGTNILVAPIQVSDVPTLNQNTTGSSASFTGTLVGDVTGTQSATVISAATVTGKLLTGYAVGTNTPILATDTILTAFGKTQGQISDLVTITTGDIPQTSFVIANNQSAPANVTGLAFANGSIESAEVQYSIVINATTSLYESGFIHLIQQSGTWSIAQMANFDNTNVIFSVTNAGQVQYTSPSYTGYSSGKMQFRALITNV